MTSVPASIHSGPNIQSPSGTAKEKPRIAKV